MTNTPAQSLTDQEIVDQLRRAAAAWFNNRDLLVLEELLRRYARLANLKDSAHATT